MGEEPLVQAHPPSGPTSTGHPGADAVGIELVVPGAVQRVGEVDPPPVPAHLDHLRATGEREVRRRGMRRTTHDPAQVPSRPPRLGGVGDVVLLQLAGSPAGDVEEAVVDGQVDVRDERWHRSERLEGGRQRVGVGRLGGDRDHLVRRHSPPSRCQRKTDADRSSVETTTPTKPQVASGSWAGRSSSAIWWWAPRSTRWLWVPPRDPRSGSRGRTCWRAAAPARAVLDHRRGAPLAADERVVPQVPPRVVGEVLRSAVLLPGADHVERAVVEEGDAAGSLVPGPGSQARQEHAVGPQWRVCGRE